MTFRARRLTRGRNQNELGFDHLLLRRRRWLWEIDLGRSIASRFLLRIYGLLKGGIVGLNLIAVTITRAHRSFLGGRSESSIEVNTVLSIQDEIIRKKKFDREAYDVLRPNFERIFFPSRGGGRLLRGAAGIALSSSSPEEKWVSPRSSESSMMLASTAFFFVGGARDGDGAAEVDSSGTSIKSRPGYSPTSGWGG
jgi:hypothetical protein